MTVSLPAAEPRDDPGTPSQGIGWIGVLLFLGATFELRLQCRHDLKLFGTEHIARSYLIVTVAGLHELADTGSGVGGHDGKLGEGVSVFALTGLQIEVLSFENAEKLLDMPALTIPVDNLGGHGGIIDRMRRQ
jgi:hypothetical protein